MPRRNEIASPMQAALEALGMTGQGISPVAALGLDQPRCQCGAPLQLGEYKLDTGESANGRGGIITTLGVCQQCQNRNAVVIRFAATVTVTPIPRGVLSDGKATRPALNVTPAKPLPAWLTSKT